jgi:hypothetical protein
MAYLGRIWAHGVSGAFMAYVSGVISRFGHSPAGISLAKNSLASFGGGALRTIATRRVGVVTLLSRHGHECGRGLPGKRCNSDHCEATYRRP